MKIEYRKGLLYTSLKIVYKSKSKVVENIIIDTGAAHTIISPKIDFGIIDDAGTINGLLGLDLLIQCEAVIDLKKLEVNI
ncbi:hypothetical protein IZY60_13695 [Lutibacter sp. B2]|nr:hypothetical protein [Lutibacter sp. B2]